MKGVAVPGWEAGQLYSGASWCSMYFLARWNSNEESGGGSTSLKKALASSEKEACSRTVLGWPSGLFTIIRCWILRLAVNDPGLKTRWLRAWGLNHSWPDSVPAYCVNGKSERPTRGCFAQFLESRNLGLNRFIGLSQCPRSSTDR